jgi:hypothetical protein
MKLTPIQRVYPSIRRHLQTIEYLTYLIRESRFFNEAREALDCEP